MPAKSRSVNSKKAEKRKAKEAEAEQAARNLFSLFYSSLWGERWNSLNRSLMEDVGYIALINRYADTSQELLHASTVTRLVELAPLVCYEPVDKKEKRPFPSPPEDDSHLLGYYLMDAASLLPVLALDIQPKDRVLDLCAAPGGKTVAISQLLDFASGGRLISNEFQFDRRKRLRRVLESYVPAQSLADEHVVVTGRDATRWSNSSTDFQCNKILVDAPCSSERHVLSKSEELLRWKSSRTKAIASKQLFILREAVEVCENDGLIVYSTCSISRFENDDVIEGILKQMGSALSVEKFSLPFGEPTKYGTITLPDNDSFPYGPIFLCRLRKH